MLCLFDRPFESGRRVKRKLARGIILILLAMAPIVFCGCRSEDAKTAESSAADRDALTEAVAPLPEAPEDPLAIKVPEGNAQELIDFLSTVAQEEPKEGATDEEKIQQIARQMEARIRASEQLQTMEEGTYEQIALQTKLESLRVLIAIGNEAASDRFLALANTLANSPTAESSHLGRIGLYQAKLDALISQGPNSQLPPADVVAALRELIKSEKLDLNLLQSANETAMLFGQVGLANESIEVFELISEAFKNHADPQLAKAAKTAAQQAGMMQLNASLGDVMQGTEGAVEKLSERLKQFDASPQVVGTLLTLAQNLEYSGNAQVAEQIYDLAAESVPKLDGESASQFKEMLSQAKIRLGLIGQDFSLEGESTDGSPFVWADYAGKVVLVDFWATWCRPCIAEIPNVKKNYEQFHDAGFDVVGVNLDDDPDDARAFLDKQDLPWTTVVSGDDGARGFDDPNAKQYAVSAIPFLVLVGRDGKVDSLHLRGPQLQRRLSELLSETPNDAVDEDAAIDGEAGDEDIEIIPEGDGLDDEKDGDMLDTPQSKSDVLDRPTETLPPDTFTDEDVNPYLAPDNLGQQELVLYLLDLKDKAKSIQRRPGFCEAVCDVADRVLASTATDAHKQLAAREKLRFLHERACLDDDVAQQQLMAAVAELRDKMPVAMASEIEFFELEEQSAPTEFDPDTLQQTIDACAQHLESQGENLDHRHLRLASNTVELINRLPADARDPQFERVSKALLLSPVRDVARYGETLMIGDTVEPSIGQAIVLKGTSVDGQTVDVEQWKGSVVLVEFWTTWCGPCRKLQPQLAELLDAFPNARLISVNLDAEEDSLNEFLAENQAPGVILFGADAKNAARQYGVRKIPTIFVIDPQSQLHAVVHTAAKMSRLIKSLETK